MDDTEQLKASKKRDKFSASASHFTCISNIGCVNYDVGIYETFHGFSDQKNLLTKEGKKLFRILLKKEDGDTLRVKAFNVALQEESGKQLALNQS